MKTIVLELRADTMSLLKSILVQYAEAAYPLGASDCAQASREALLNAAGLIDKAISDKKTSVELSRRLKATIKAAVKYGAELEKQEKIALPGGYNELFKVFNIS